MIEYEIDDSMDTIIDEDNSRGCISSSYENMRDAVFKSFEVTAGIEEGVELTPRQLLTGLSLRLPCELRLNANFAKRGGIGDNNRLIWLDVTFDAEYRNMSLLTMGPEGGFPVIHSVKEAVRYLQKALELDASLRGADYHRLCNMMDACSYSASSSFAVTPFLRDLCEALVYPCEEVVQSPHKTNKNKVNEASLESLLFHECVSGKTMRWPIAARNFTRDAVRSFFSGLANCLRWYGHDCNACDKKSKRLQKKKKPSEETIDLYLAHYVQVDRIRRSKYCSPSFTRVPDAKKLRSDASGLHHHLWDNYSGSYLSDQFLCLLRVFTNNGSLFAEEGSGWILSDTTSLERLLFETRYANNDGAAWKRYLPGMQISNYKERVCENCRDDKDESEEAAKNRMMAGNTNTTRRFLLNPAFSRQYEVMTSEPSLSFVDKMDNIISQTALRLSDVFSAWRPCFPQTSVVSIAHCNPCPWISIGLFVPVTFRDPQLGVRILFNPAAMHALHEYIRSDLAFSGCESDIQDMLRLVGGDFFYDEATTDKKEEDGHYNHNRLFLEKLCEQIVAPVMRKHVIRLQKEASGETNSSSSNNNIDFASADTAQRHHHIATFSFDRVFHDSAPEIMSSFKALGVAEVDIRYTMVRLLLLLLMRPQMNKQKDLDNDVNAADAVTEEEDASLFCARAVRYEFEKAGIQIITSSSSAKGEPRFRVQGGSVHHLHRGQILDDKIKTKSTEYMFSSPPFIIDICVSSWTRYRKF